MPLRHGGVQPTGCLRVVIDEICLLTRIVVKVDQEQGDWECAIKIQTWVADQFPVVLPDGQLIPL